MFAAGVTADTARIGKGCQNLERNLMKHDGRLSRPPQKEPGNEPPQNRHLRPGRGIVLAALLGTPRPRPKPSTRARTITRRRRRRRRHRPAGCTAAGWSGGSRWGSATFVARLRHRLRRRRDGRVPHRRHGLAPAGHHGRLLGGGALLLGRRGPGERRSLQRDLHAGGAVLGERHHLDQGRHRPWAHPGLQRLLGGDINGNVDDESGFAFMLAAGIELVQSYNFALDLQLRYGNAAYDREAAVVTATSISSASCSASTGTEPPAGPPAREARLQRNDLVGVLFPQRACGVAGVDDQLRAIAQRRVVDVAVVGGDENAVVRARPSRSTRSSSRARRCAAWARTGRCSSTSAPRRCKSSMMSSAGDSRTSSMSRL